jgi:hypothetical protein
LDDWILNQSNGERYTVLRIICPGIRFERLGECEYRLTISYGTETAVIHVLDGPICRENAADSVSIARVILDILGPLVNNPVKDEWDEA